MTDAMKLSECLRPAHFDVSAGLAPSLEKLNAETNSYTRDWTDGTEHELALEKEKELLRTGGMASNLQQNSQVRAAVLQLWDQFAKTAENFISREEYEGFIARVTRVLLPGLEPEQERVIAVHTWEEDAGGAGGLPFVAFFGAMIRLATVWTDSREPVNLALFLEDLLCRVTVVRVTIARTGEVVQRDRSIAVRFWFEELSDATMPKVDFGSDIVLTCRGLLPQFRVEAKFERTASFSLIGVNICWFREVVLDATETGDPTDAITREWAPLESIVPVGRASMLVLRQLESLGEHEVMDIDATPFQPPPESPLQGVRVALPRKKSFDVVGKFGHPDDVAVVEGTGQPLTIRDLLSVGLKETVMSNIVLVRPAAHSVLYKLSDVRQGLMLQQLDAVKAAVPEGVDKNERLRLPHFTDLVKGEVAVDPSSGLAKRVEGESLLLSGSLSVFGEAFVVSAENAPKATNNMRAVRTEVLESLRASGKVRQRESAAPFTKQFPQQQDQTVNEDDDLLRIVRMSPFVLWAIGECGAGGEYKTEVCRRVAEKLGLQWLQPAFLLELAVQTPEERRTPLMKRCVEQLQRGLVVSVGDALRLTLEMMSSVRCKTSGYILDFPSVTCLDEDAHKEVADFIEQVYTLSGQSSVRWEDFLRDSVVLPDRMPEPEPPEKPAVAGDEDAEGGGEGATEDDAEGGLGEDGGETPNKAEEPASADATERVTDSGAVPDTAGDEATEGEEGQQPEEKPPTPIPPPPAPLVPNPLANCLPRRVIVLSMQEDSLAAWKIARLKEQHAEKDRRLKELEEAGEEPPEEEEEEEAPELPPLEDELFDDTAGDLLAAMSPRLEFPALAAPKKLPPLPDETQLIDQEVVDKRSFKEGEAVVVKIIHETRKVPMLSLHMDGRSPEEVADLIEVATGSFSGPRVPLPVTIESEADSEPKEVLRLQLGDKQATRRWSPWRLHCPVSLYEGQLLAGSSEFAVEYAGCVFVFVDKAKMIRFRAWPKLFLQDAPRISLTGMHLGYVLLSPGGYRCQELAQELHNVYGFDIVDVAALVEEAVSGKLLDDEVEAALAADSEAAEDADSAAFARAQWLPEEVWTPRLYAEEKEALQKGLPVSADTAIRLIAGKLGILKNLSLIKEEKKYIEDAEKAVEEAKAAEQEPPENIKLDEDGKVITAPLDLAVPTRGFVLLGFPESAEQFSLLQEQLQLELERVLLLKSSEEDPAEWLVEHCEGDLALFQPAWEAQKANLEALEASETLGLQIESVALELELHEQFVHLQKLIDPFYPVVDDPSMAADIPDPDEWTPPEPEAPDEDDDAGQKDLEPEERPFIPWGTCGPYCPVTLYEDFWLFPGQKEFQHVFKNQVYALATEALSQVFLAEPVKYVPMEQEPTVPPPRILIVGPTGTNVAKQCEMLSQLYHIPLISLWAAWTANVDKRIALAKAARKAEMLEASGGQPAEDAAAEGEEAAEDDELDEDAKVANYVEAMKDVLGKHTGACIIDGTFFGDLNNEELDDEAKAARSLHKLLLDARRLPDLTLILKCKHETAARAALDLDAIDREYNEKKEVYLKAVEMAEAQELDPPDPPEGLDLDLEEDEKASDRVKAEFILKKKAEQEVLAEFVEALVAARAHMQKVNVDRGIGPGHAAIKWHCRSYIEQRSSVIVRLQANKVQNSKALDMISRTIGLPSMFGKANPLINDAPLFAGRSNITKFPVAFRGRIYYPHSEEERATFLERPMDFIHLPAPSRVAVHPAVSICGPPLSGKTELARQLAERTGAVYVSIPEIVEWLCSAKALSCGLSQEILCHIRAGEKVPDKDIVAALQHRLASADVLSRGWVMDDFPLTETQAEMLTAAGIVPHRFFVINIPDGFVFSRCKELEARGGEADLMQQQEALQRLRLDAYVRTSPSLRAYYATNFDNVRDIDVGGLAWASFDRAMADTSQSISQRLAYYRKTAAGLATPVFGMCFTPTQLAQSESPWRNFCPVKLTLSNELAHCQDPACIVEYKSLTYRLSSPENMQLFLDDPESFLQVPLPAAVPSLLSALDRRSPPNCQLDGYCPVALVERSEVLKGPYHHMVEYQAKYYNLETMEAKAKFYSRPMRYVKRAALPNKKPALRSDTPVPLANVLLKGREGKSVEPADMLTYMEASVAEVVCQGLVESCARRPLYLGKTSKESALLFLAHFFKAKNPLLTDMHAAKLRSEFGAFVASCALPQQLREMSDVQELANEKRSEYLELVKQREEDGDQAEGPPPEEVDGPSPEDVQRLQDCCLTFDQIFATPA